MFKEVGSPDLVGGGAHILLCTYSSISLFVHDYDITSLEYGVTEFGAFFKCWRRIPRGTPE